MRIWASEFSWGRVLLRVAFAVVRVRICCCCYVDVFASFKHWRRIDHDVLAPALRVHNANVQVRVFYVLESPSPRVLDWRPSS